ncbi:MAG: gliding motility-associated C-terminal domain-containing protein [Phaeodactylibacter sp.]|nr:gliding motility-associated C-terminal domain-containing protein [Phaeodactylibacter sp.]
MTIFPILSLLAVLSFAGVAPGLLPGGAVEEVCDNGRDDDADGLADLNDPDCDCALAVPVSLIPNPSFEERTCCPAFRAQMHCAADWIQASSATTDYLHTCGWMGWGGLPPPLPFPDGDACIGFRDGRPPEDNGEAAQPNWKEYAGACLTSPLLAGTHYRFEFYLGFTHLDNSPSIKLSFFGAAGCASLPFGGGDSDFGCPANSPDWLELGAVTVEGINEWKSVRIDIVPEQDIYAIAIGPGCAPRVSIFSLYYFFDKLVLADAREFEFQPGPLAHPCSGDFGLSVPYYDTLQYQWYRNGLALPGETAHQLAGIDEEGVYQVRLLGPGSCRVTPSYRHQVPATVREVARVICPGETYSFGGRELAESGTYLDTLKTRDGCDSIVRLRLEVAGEMVDTAYIKIFEGENWEVAGKSYSRPGEYFLALTSGQGCDSLVYLFLDHYKIYIPSAFSPNGDGYNDTFFIFAGEDIDAVLRFQVFSRWGSLVFELEMLPPNTPGSGWDGKTAGRDAPPGLYAYQAVVRASDGREHQVRGAVMLVR